MIAVTSVKDRVRDKDKDKAETTTTAIIKIADKMEIKSLEVEIRMIGHKEVDGAIGEIMEDKVRILFEFFVT